MISMENKKPLSPHIQIYSWHISSLVSISHRITGIINIIAITVICFWSCWLILGENNYDFINYFLGSLISKFIILGVVWSFSFQILSEIRHLIMDMGYGFELQTTKVTGLLVIFGSLVLTVLIYLIGRNFI
jgi:succinate dehydrogenase / fumarate reductase cytochrome b subunit